MSIYLIMENKIHNNSHKKKYITQSQTERASENQIKTLDSSSGHRRSVNHKRDPHKQKYRSHRDNQTKK